MVTHQNHLYQYQNEIDYLLKRLNEIVLQNLDSLPMGEADHLHLYYVNDKFVLKNFPAELKTMDFGVEMVLEHSKFVDEIEQ